VYDRLMLLLHVELASWGLVQWCLSMVWAMWTCSRAAGHTCRECMMDMCRFHCF